MVVDFPFISYAVEGSNAEGTLGIIPMEYKYVA